MDLAIAIGQGLGLAVAAGFFATAPLAVASSVAALGFADGSLAWADDPLTVALLWVLAGIELVADAIWPGAEAGGRLLRRGVGGGLVFELVGGDELPYVGPAVGARVGAPRSLARRPIPSRAVPGRGGGRGAP